MKELIIFLIRKKLGLKRYEKFRFANQKSKHDYYYFTDDRVMKKWCPGQGYYEYTRESNVSLNWLLSNDCKIIRIE